MKSGFSKTLDRILRQFGMRTGGVIGTNLGAPITMNMFARKFGYRIESGLSTPNYDFVYLSLGETNLSNIMYALTKIDYGCIIVFRMNKELMTTRTMDAIQKALHSKLYLYEFDDNKFFGVLLKGR